MKRFILILAALFTLVNLASAQVGIGSAPNPNSILDLSNNSNKYILMPAASATPTYALLDSVASMIYFNGNLFFNNGTTITNTLSPWDWDGTTNGPISSPAGAPVGIGITPSSLFRLQVADAASGVSLAATNASIGIGNDLSAAMHLEIDNNEIMVKNTSFSADILHLQKEGGVVEIGMSALPTNNDVLQVNGNIDAVNKGKIKEHGYDLLPAGAIILWNSLSIPPGWALCDGGAYPTILDSTILTQTPDLRERFVVGAGYNAAVVGPGYSAPDSGGVRTNVHVHNVNIPTTPTYVDGVHQHSFTTSSGSSTSGVCNTSERDASSTSHTHTSTTDLGGAHSHSVSFPSFDSGGATLNDNRPSYFASVYIMKL
jgi:hypothetical protein